MARKFKGATAMQLPHQIVGKKHRSQRVLHEKIRQTADAARTWRPVLVQGCTFKAQRTITPDQYGLLDVDPSYQRGRTDMITTIIAALQAGGSVPDVPDVAHRSWGPKDGKLWILDGFQRISAFQELNMSYIVNVFDTEDLEAEKRFFLAKNNRRSLTSNTKVKSWSGPVVDLLRALNTKPGGALYGRIAFDGSGGDKLSAAILVRGIERLLSGARSQGDIQRSLSRTDGQLVTMAAKQQASVFCEVVALSFPKGYALGLPVLALAEVARLLWMEQGRNSLPTPVALARIRNINWRAQLPGLASNNVDLATAIIRRYWK